MDADAYELRETVNQATNADSVTRLTGDGTILNLANQSHTLHWCVAEGADRE